MKEIVDITDAKSAGNQLSREFFAAGVENSARIHAWRPEGRYLILSQPPLVRYPVEDGGRTERPHFAPQMVETMAIDALDRTAKQIVLTVQDYSLFAVHAVTNLVRPPRYWTDFLLQCNIIGVGSASIVLMSGFFTGGVLALQSSATLSQFGATAVTGRFVSTTMIRELGPVLTGIMVAGRNASSMASELGSMIVTEQIDAMRALGVDPMRKLVTPRLFACILMLFFLTILADAFGIMGGGFVTVFMNHQNGTQYLSMAWEHLRYPDVIQGLAKPLFSGFIIASIGCFYGMRTTGGTEGVGRSTIQAVVVASVLIIFVDFLVTQILLTLFPPL